MTLLRSSPFVELFNHFPEYSFWLGVLHFDRVDTASISFGRVLSAAWADHGWPHTPFAKIIDSSPELHRCSFGTASERLRGAHASSSEIPSTASF